MNHQSSLPQASSASTLSVACRAVVSLPIVAVALASAFACLLPERAIADSPRDADSRTLGVVTYNIKHGQGNDRRVDLLRTGQVLERLGADFIALQEVDENTQRSGQVDQAAQLGKQLKMHHAFGPFMDYEGGRYGLAILSRYRINRSEVVPLPKGNEPRVALAVDVTLPSGQSIVLVNLHFDWVKDDGFRFAQASALKQYLDRLEKPYILLGDFNDQAESRTVKLFADSMLAADKPPGDRFTFSSDKPRIEIDFIFAAPKTHWKIEQVEVIDEALASDHRPVFSRWTYSGDTGTQDQDSD